MRAAVVRRALVAGLLCAGPVAHAEVLPSDAVVTLPSPERLVPIVRPDGVSDGDATVLTLTVDAGGGVRSVVGDGTPLGDAAANAAWDWRFQPGVSAEGLPVSAEVRYRVVVGEETAAPASVVGVVRGAEAWGDGLVLRWAGPDGDERTVRVAPDGRFALAGLRDGDWSVRWGEALLASVTLPSARPVTLGLPEGEVVEVVGVHRDDEPVVHTLGGRVLSVLPGTNGDVIRGVQNLPGLARPPLGVGQLVIRGTDPEESRASVDGLDLPNVFHFGGISTVLPSDLVAEVSLLPGNWSVRYGRNLGGRLEVVTADTLPASSTGYASLDLFQAAAAGSFRVSERTAVFVAARRSYIDSVLSPLLSEGEQVFRAPRYYDAQLRVLHRLRSGASVDLLALLSDDRFSTGRKEDDGEVLTRIGYGTDFQKVRLRVREELGDGWRHEFAALVGSDRQLFRLSGDNEAYERRVGLDLRYETVWTRDDGGRLRMGFDVQSSWTSYRFAVDRFGPEEDGAAFRFMPAVYVEPTWALGPVSVTPAVRADLVAQSDGYLTWTIDPRLNLAFRVSPTTTLRVDTGRFSQIPTVRQTFAASDGTADLRPGWSWQTAVGLRQQLPFDLSLELSAYYNHLADLVVGREDRLRFFTTPPPFGPMDTYPYANAGKGSVVGAELLLRWTGERGTAWLSATFGRSERVDRDGVRAPFVLDQPYVITAVGTGTLPRGWRVGARARLVAGSPYTPILNRIYDLDSRAFLPVFGEPRSARLPPFFSLDLRVDKTWRFRTWDFTFYLDLQNVTNTRNPEVIQWTWDYGGRNDIRGLPIVPAFGFRWDW